MIYTRFYDQVLTEIEAGNVHDGINLLVGMLDTVDLHAGSLDRARRELRGHTLCEMLREDPAVAHAYSKPDRSADRLRMFSQPPASVETSSTGRRLFKVTRELTFARALRDRRDSFRLKLSRGRHQQQNICLIADDSTAYLSTLKGKDMPGIEVFDVDGVTRTSFCNADGCPQYELIIAPDLLDRCDPTTLLNRLTLMRSSLSRQGSIILAGLTPQHLGTGWRRACLNWHPFCYDERGLTAIATEAGLAARTYRDETDCIIWAELKGTNHCGACGETGDAR